MFVICTTSFAAEKVSSLISVGRIVEVRLIAPVMLGRSRTVPTRSKSPRNG